MTPLLLHELSHIIMYVLFDIPFLNPMILPLCVFRYSKRILMHHIYKGLCAGGLTMMFQIGLQQYVTAYFPVGMKPSLYFYGGSCHLN